MMNLSIRLAGVLIYKQNMKDIYVNKIFQKPVFVTDYPKEIKAFLYETK